jgi:hydrogenase nickel incorporation protein HypA/HybF
MSIVQALIEQVTAEVEQSPHDGRVLGLDLIIGRMSGVHVDSIRFGFEMLSPGTLVESAELRIQEPKAALHCRACGKDQEIEQILLECAFCGSREISIEGGQQLILQSIELADESYADSS